MGKRKNIKLFYQFKIAIDKCFKPGIDKHSYKSNNCGKEKIFSYSYRRNIISKTDQFCKYISKEYTEIKLIKELTSYHIQAFLNYKGNTCSYETLKSYVYYFKKLERMVRQEMYLKVDYTSNVVIEKNKDTKRNIAMKEEDLNQIQDELDNSRSKAAIGIKLGMLFGLRVSEICKLQGRDIKLEEKMLHIHESKGKRSRDLEIDTVEKMELCKEIKACVNDKERIVPLREDSVNAFLRKKLLKNNITKYKDKTTGIHSIRKMYAKEVFKKEIISGKNIKDATDRVSLKLGHNKDRKITYTAYIGSM